MICQRVKGDRHFVANDAAETKTKFTSGGAFVNDNPTPYGGTTVNLSNSDTKAIMQADSPTSPLAGYKKATADDSFETYLMYKPSGADSVWVTLRMLTWNWSGTAALGGGGWGVAGGTPANPSQNIDSSDSATLPEWADCWTNQEFVPD
jgi:hypothetical protein